MGPFFRLPSEAGKPVGACHRSNPIQGEWTPTRKGNSGQRWGLKKALGSLWNVT